MREVRPLYRKVNTKARRHGHAVGGDYRHERNTKAVKGSDALRAPMRGKSNRGLDYTPLFQFLLSSVGRDWDEVHSEAVARLDREEPMFWLVARTESERQATVRIGESSYYSGLFVDDNNTLQLVDPTATVENMKPSCRCCTHTFNGVPFTQEYPSR